MLHQCVCSTSKKLMSRLSSTTPEPPRYEWCLLEVMDLAMASLAPKTHESLGVTRQGVCVNPLWTLKDRTFHAVMPMILDVPKRARPASKLQRTQELWLNPKDLRAWQRNHQGVTRITLCNAEVNEVENLLRLTIHLAIVKGYLPTMTFCTIGL